MSGASRRSAATAFRERIGQNSTVRRIQGVLRKEDLRRHPLRGIFRRAVWRLRWLRFPNQPWLLRAHGGMRLFVPRGGAGALIYYQGAAEPETADFITRVLRPGMVFVDAGAHIGEHTVLGATLVRPSGYVHAFEPQQDIFKLLTRNIELNDCQNVTPCPLALWHEEAVLEFELTPEPSTSALRVSGRERTGAALVKVPAVSLDHYVKKASVSRLDLIKIDVEGAELHVLRGATSILRQPPGQAPILIIEYEPPNLERFGHSFAEILEFLGGFGYSCYSLCLGKLIPVHKRGAKLFHADNTPVLPCNLVAAKTALLLS